MDDNRIENTQTLGDSTYGAIHSAIGSFNLSGDNIMRNLGALSPGEFTQGSSGATMRLSVKASAYRPNVTQIRVLSTAQYATNTTTLAELTGLTLTLRPYRTYLVKCSVNFTLGDVDMGTKFGWTTPAGITAFGRQEFVYNGQSGSVNDARAYTEWTTATSGSLNTTTTSPWITTGTIRTGATGGSFYPSFAQNTATANIMTINSGSFIEATELVNE